MIYTVKNHTYDFDGLLPVVDGCRLRSKSAINAEIHNFLKYIGYNFAWPRSIPPILSNWRDISSVSLIKFFKSIVSQYSLFPNYVNILYLRLCPSGWADSSCDRLVTVRLTANGQTGTHFCLFKNLTSYVHNIIECFSMYPDFCLVIG